MSGLLCPLGPARMTTGSSGVLVPPDQSEQRENASQIDLLLGPQAGWPIDSSQDLGTKKEHRAKVDLCRGGPVYQPCPTGQGRPLTVPHKASPPLSQGFSPCCTRVRHLHCRLWGFAAAFDSNEAEFLVCKKAWESNSNALGYVIVVGDDVWWSASHRNVFYFYLQVSVFLSSIYLGAKNSAGQALRKSIATSIY